MNFIKLLLKLPFFLLGGCASVAASTEIAGCYRIEMNPGAVYITHEGNVSKFSIPEEIELSNEPMAGFVNGSGLMVVRSLKENAEGWSDCGLWEIVGERISLRIGDDYSGVSALLTAEAGIYIGGVRPYADFGPAEITQGKIRMEKTTCKK